MKITYLGTASSVAWPALFCDCEACMLARKCGGKNIRTRSQTLIGESLLIDFPPDTNYHVQKLGLDLKKIESLIITHSHHDHFFPYDICMRNAGFAEGIRPFKLSVYGNRTVEEKFYEAASIFSDVDEFIEFHQISPFDQFRTGDGYTVTALAADHNQPEESLIYIIQKNGQSVLYAHDTGIFPEITWKYLEGKYFDFVSLDCTALSRDWRKGHMGFRAVDEVTERMKAMRCISHDTILVLNHFAHYEDYTHDKICKEVENKNYCVAYDGCQFVF